MAPQEEAPQEEAPQEGAPQRPDRPPRFGDDDPSAPEAAPLSRPPPTPLLIKTLSGFASIDRLPTVEPRRVEVEWEGELPSIEDVWAGQSGG
jgi:hypothetical protein